MALKFIDTGKHQATADMSGKWSTASNAAIVSGGRWGGNCIRLLTTLGYVIYTNSSAEAEWAVEGWFKSGVLGAGQLIAFLNGTTSQCELRTDGAGELYVARNGTSLETTSGLALTTNTWYFIQFKVNIDNSGSWQVKFNGVEILSGSGDTLNTATADNARLYARAAGDYSYWEDVAISCGSGTTFLTPGEIHGEAIMPNGAGDNTAWTPSTGNNYACVDEIPPDSADYVESSTASQKDDYAYPSVSVAGTILCVQTTFQVYKTDAGVRQVRPYCKRGASYAYGNTITLGSAAQMITYPWATDPIASAAWTPSNLANTKFGMELVA